MSKLTYYQSAVIGAGPVRLVILLYDRLILDLNRAVEAMQTGDVEKRVEQVNHAMLILQQLEGSLESEQDPVGASIQSQFYSITRAKILEAHIKSSVEIFKQQVALFQDVRLAWETVEKADESQGTGGSPTVALEQAPRSLDTAL